MEPLEFGDFAAHAAGRLRFAVTTIAVAEGVGRSAAGR
jgi:hypothetical protein